MTWSLIRNERLARELKEHEAQRALWEGDGGEAREEARLHLHQVAASQGVAFEANTQ